MGGYGKTIIIQHSKSIETVYAHCKELNYKEGDQVDKGDVIASVGTTGYSTGPYLHLEMRLGGKLVDPADLIDRE